MRLLPVCYIIGLIVFAACNVARVLDPPLALTSNASTNLSHMSETSDDTPPSSPESEEPKDATWRKVRCCGEALLKAMTLDEDDAMAMLHWPYTQSPWDGDLKVELRKWGYLDDNNRHAQTDSFCDFENHHHLKTAFDALGVDTRSAEMGGPNHCFMLQHCDGPEVMLDENGNMPPLHEQRYEVDGKIYKVTNAYNRMGINRNYGILYFINRKSPEIAAAELWGYADDEVDAEELPKLRSSSDMAWGLWNRVPGEQNINMIMSCEIVNEDTQDVIIPRALAAAAEPVDEVQPWPGTDLLIGADNDEEADAALALIGSPNGLGAGYFLLQHKAQLGGANFIYKVRIFRGDDEWEDAPYIIFYVDKHAPPTPGPEGTPESSDESGDGVAKLVQRAKVPLKSASGRHVLREHIIWAKL